MDCCTAIFVITREIEKYARQQIGSHKVFDSTLWAGFKRPQPHHNDW
jgi:hypothetical protein